MSSGPDDANSKRFSYAKNKVFTLTIAKSFSWTMSNGFKVRDHSFLLPKGTIKLEDWP